MSMAGVFDLFKPGVGPSSSHTMGPMTAAALFVAGLGSGSPPFRVSRLTVSLYGSLALTGRGHATDRAVILGLMGHEPATIDLDIAEAELAALRRSGFLRLGQNGARIAFVEERDILWCHGERTPVHPNTMKLSAVAADGATWERVYHSIGGGFVVEAGAPAAGRADTRADLPHPFCSGAELLARAEAATLSIAELMLANEVAARPLADVLAGLDAIAAAMESCIDRGLRQGGVLPGGLDVPRRAQRIHRALLNAEARGSADPLAAMDWINLWALAVNEENAAGGRVVTAPTNGAAGIIPAVLRYHVGIQRGTVETRRIFLLTAAAIGSLYKRNASISGAEVGCQGEVGVACSMAAAGLVAASGGSNAQIENAAEIAMEHNLGLTCDQIGGLVQIPCIERNAIGAVKAVDAARLALLGDGRHAVSLDKVIATMKRTGEDMKDIYKETSLGGLAVCAVEC